MDKPCLDVKVISICLLLSISQVSCTCSGFSSLGYTYPVGDIMLEYNASVPLEITCVITNSTLINETPNISSQLYFSKDNSNVSLDKIIRLNETSVKLAEENPAKMLSFYKCMLDKSAICLNTVYVDTKPEPVTDFKCIGYNYENLTCSFTPPHNYIPTNYSLSYTFPKTRAGNRPTDCNVTHDKTTRKRQCFWSLGTKPHYRQVQAEYNFTLKSENRFGLLEQVFLFDHLKNILSGPPENLSCINTTTSSLLLKWQVPNTIVPFPDGLQHRILYQCKFGPKVWQHGGIIDTKEKSEVTYNLTGLKHAHDVCDIRVAIRVREADSEEMWSANSSVTALTSSTIPGAAPKVNIGSFQTDIVANLRDIYIYWQQIPMNIRNAENFQYTITASDGNLDISNKMTELTNSYAKYSNMSWHLSYNFVIRSKNSEGLSKDSTVVMVPSNNKMIGEPVAFTKVAYDNGFYKLSWEKPKRGAEYIQNYTLFWCNNEKDRPYQCTGYLNWTEVSADITEYNITVSEDYATQFAISANNATSSSGMVWATCTLIHNKLITKIKDVWITHVGSTFIELGWKLDCADRSDSVAGFVIYYCPRAKGSACSKRMKVVVNNPYAISGRVSQLTPYTTYMLTVSVVNKQGSESLESDPLYNTTYEDVATEPYGLNVTHVTNSSITVTWEPPKKINGYLRNYEVHYNNSKVDTNKTTYTLEYLQSDTIYNISISACTLKCSKRSIPVLVLTKVGYPGRIPNLWHNIENQSLVLQWSKTEEKRKQNLYELKIVYKSNNQNVTLPLVNITKNKYILERCDKDGKYFNYYVSVRAVNEDNETNYTGPWSDEYETSCTPKEQPYLIWIIVGIGCVFLIAMMLISAKKLFIYFNDMKTVDVKMPPGLDPKIDGSWPEPKPISSPSDEERLLNKTFIPQCGDSSGCSSGQHSVSSHSGSSITSTSDSGTEQPRTPTDEEPKTSLLMNVSTLKSESDQPYVQFSERLIPLSINPNANGYSLYGISDANNSEIELMSIPSSNMESSPYTTSEQFMKPIEEPKPNTYVPLNNTQNKNPPYVMAANKSLFNVDERAYVQVADVNGVLKDKAEAIGIPEMDDEDLDMHNNTNGYISYGDAVKTVPEINTTSSYVPHTPYDITALRND